MTFGDEWGECVWYFVMVRGCYCRVIDLEEPGACSHFNRLFRPSS